MYETRLAYRYAGTVEDMTLDSNIVVILILHAGG